MQYRRHGMLIVAGSQTGPAQLADPAGASSIASISIPVQPKIAVNPTKISQITASHPTTSSTLWIVGIGAAEKLSIVAIDAEADGVSAAKVSDLTFPLKCFSANSAKHKTRAI